MNNVCSYFFILGFSQPFYVTLIRLSYRSQIIFIYHFESNTCYTLMQVRLSIWLMATCDRDMCKRELFLCMLSIGMYTEHSLYCLIESNARERAVRSEFSEARYKFLTIGCAGENQIKERRTIYQ